MKKENYKKVVEMIQKDQILREHLRKLELTEIANITLSDIDYLYIDAIKEYFKDLCKGVTSLSVDETNTIKDILIKRLKSDIKDIESEINEL